MIILDTNVVSELMKPSPDGQVQNWLRATGDIALTTTAITVSEIEYGLQRLPTGRRRDDMERRFASLVGALSVLPFDDAAAFRAGQFRAAREAAGTISSPSDMMIAGIVGARSAVLATRNIRDFEGLPIQLIDPWRAS